MKAISYAIFGYKRHMQNSYQFDTYMRGLWVNFRVNRVLYPGWQIVINTDDETVNSHYIVLFDYMMTAGQQRICPSKQSLCLSMLWRLKPAFERNSELKSVFSHVICRDCESIGTYREAQMVQEWIAEDKTLHCITDSISHNIPMMGGMVGFRPAYLSQRMGVNTWDQLMALNPGIDFNRKGSDQDFMNRIMYHKLADSATEHFILGMKHTVTPTGGRHYEVPDIEVDGVDPIHKSLNDCAGHVGASGFYEAPMIKWLNETDPFREEYADIERQFPQICFWRK
jgi:hypothetical protein